MDDTQIIQLFLERKETAIEELDKKYNRFCFRIAWNILRSREDSEECVNDTWFRTWSYIPPKRPAVLSAFVGKITRGLALDRLRKKYAAKRIDLHIADIELETAELDRFTADIVEDKIAEQEFYETLNRFLWSLPERDRDMFLRRYWHMDSLEEIALRHGKTVGSVRGSLYRSRKKLYKLLRTEGVLR